MRLCTATVLNRLRETSLNCLQDWSVCGTHTIRGWWNLFPVELTIKCLNRLRLRQCWLMHKRAKGLRSTTEGLPSVAYSDFYRWSEFKYGRPYWIFLTIKLKWFVLRNFTPFHNITLLVTKGKAGISLIVLHTDCYLLTPVFGVYFASSDSLLFVSS